MKKLSYLGIGPKIGIVVIPLIAVTIVLSIKKSPLFMYSSRFSVYLLIAGIILMITGLVFYFSTVRLLHNAIRESRLMTSGAYSLCQNPLYSSFLLFLIPSLSLILNSWLIITTSIVGFILFKIFIREEYKELEKYFGEEYLRYKKETPELLPFPLKKWRS